jgi:uncharacterized protein (TIGR03083 family)
MDEIDYVALYRETREGMCAFVSGLDEAHLAARIPAAPEWTAHDALAHVTGICADILAGNLTDVGGDAWTAAQVDARRDLSVAEIVAEWAETGPQVEAIAAAAGPAMAMLLISDLATHTFDVRGVSGDTSTRDSDTAALVYDSYVASLATRLEAAGAPALRVVDDGHERVVGSGEPSATVRTTRFELIRALSGRRNADQIRSYDWDGDSEPYMSSFAQYPMRETPLVE